MTTAFSRCLPISAIFEQIATEARETDGGLSSLAALAVTSRTLYEHVLPVLWEKLDSLVPLLRLLPAHTWTERMNSENVMVFRLTTTKNIDWSRFDMHARHVRTFTWGNGDVWISMLTDLPLAKPSNEPFLPNLRTLAIHDYWQGWDISKLSFLFSPRLVDLRIHWHEDYCPDRLLQAIRERCGPALKDLRLSLNVLMPYTYHLDPDQTTQDLLAQCIAALPGLRHLSCLLPPSPTAIRALAALPCLQTLAMRLPARKALADIVDDLHMNTRTGSWFPALTDLNFIGDALDDNFVALLASFDSPLKVLTARTHDQPSTHGMRRLMETIARSAYAESLTALKICLVAHSSDPFDREPDFPTVDFGEAFKPMLQRPLPQLDALYVENDSMTVSDEVLIGIAESYPSLRSLTIRSSDGSPAPSVDSLLTVLQKCPRLSSFTVPFTRRDANKPSQVELDRLVHSESSTRPLEHLSVIKRLLTSTIEIQRCQMPHKTHRIF